MDIEDNKIKPIGEMLQDKIHRLKKENFKLQARTDRLTVEIEKADTVIDLMADKLVEAHEWFYSEFDNYTKEDFKEYFYKKAEEK